MAQPTAYNRVYNFTNFQTSAPTTPLPANQVDAEFNAVETTLDATLVNLALLQRDDGALANAVVTPDSLTLATRLLITSDWTPRGDWLTATAYAVKDMVENAAVSYVCVTAHTSGTFATDLSAGKWMALGGSTSAATLAFTPAGSIAATTVQAAIEELDAEKQPLDADLTAIAALTSASDKVPYSTGLASWAMASLSAYGRTLIDDADATAARTTLGLGTASTLTAGTLANNVVQLDGTAKLPAVDGSQLTNLSPVSAATQAEMEAASSTTVYAPPGRAHFHPAVAKAWCKWDVAGTVGASRNVSSVTDNGTGDWTVNFTTAFSSVDYAVALGFEAATAGSFNGGIQVGASGQAAGSCRVQGSNIAGGVALDHTRMYLVCFGDFA